MTTPMRSSPRSGTSWTMFGPGTADRRPRRPRSRPRSLVYTAAESSATNRRRVRGGGVMKFERVLRAALAAAAFSLALAPGAHAQPVAPKPAFATPAPSPDGAEIAFASGGDIWTVPAAGGVARLLVTDPATEERPVYSPDGRELAFTSTRNGAPNIYILTLATGAVRRLTWSDAAE